MKKEIYSILSIAFMCIYALKMALAQKGFRFKKWALVIPVANWAFQTGDFNSDGKIDVVGYHPSNGTLWVGTNQGHCSQIITNLSTSLK